MSRRADPQRLRRAFSQNLRAARAARGWTQEKLAEHSGLSLVFINRVENGVQAISIDSLQLVSDALGLAAGALLAESDADSP
ncbi:helix-turn-helix transcriptional regulator [Nevskia sp.]|uniref:helix-turn-helix domain-containing protein n=1 Tax=Nevskia sp. TaxID=1929292 RepID=UPI0025D9B329|nr:helix-turn-helix transcriptional regulator [Nevskia sp.]